MAEFGQIVIKDAETIRDDILRSIRVGFGRIGITNINVAPGSDYYILATAVGGECAVAQANTPIASDQTMPDTAVGEGRIRPSEIS